MIGDDFCLKETPYSEIAFDCRCQNFHLRRQSNFTTKLLYFTTKPLYFTTKLLYFTTKQTFFLFCFYST